MSHSGCSKIVKGSKETKFATATGSDKKWQKSSAEMTGASLKIYSKWSYLQSFIAFHFRKFHKTYTESQEQSNK